MRSTAPDCKILILTTFGRPAYLWGAMGARALVFLVKDEPASELAEVIRRAMRGERMIDSILATAALSSGPNKHSPTNEHTPIHSYEGEGSLRV